MYNFEGNTDVSGFVSASGQAIVNGEGKEFLLRGVGLGSWLLPEGYMWRMPEGGDRPRRIEKMTQDLLGREKADSFWAKYYDSYITEEDIRFIAELGFNSIRLPINSRPLLNDDSLWDRIDAAVSWCRKYRIYIILDLHGAPGGQTGANIDDSEFDLPELFTRRANAVITVELWRKIARRYKDEWIVAGYDLLNEPLPEWFSKYNDRLVPLYTEIIQAVREIDQRHMIILEGAHWATDWSMFTGKLDSNMMLQFHKYWNNPDEESLLPFLERRKELNVPIYMGEGGENNTDWYAGAFRLFEDLNISWNFWTWKKMDTANSPVSIIKPDNWDLLTDYLEGGKCPEPETAEQIFNKYLENIRFENCVFRPGVSNSILRRPPLRIPAVFYSYKGFDRGFHVSKPEKGLSCGFRANDGVKMGFTTGEKAAVNFSHGGGEQWTDDEWMYVELDSNDWLAYDFMPGGKSVDLDISIKAVKIGKDARIKIMIDSHDVGD